jgi:hypothetical protein
MNTPNAPIQPPGWTEDGLSAFYDLSIRNVYTSFFRLPEKYRFLSVLHETFEKIIDHRPYFLPPVPYSFLVMSHSSFLGSALLALSGFTSESYSLARSTLESSLYCFFAFDDEDKQEIWLRRDENETQQRLCRNTFTIGATFNSLQDRNSELKSKAKLLYDEAIKHGAHPNIMAFAQRVISRNRVDESFNYLDVNTESHELCLKRCTQIGRTSLHIFKLLGPDIFDEL